MNDAEKRLPTTALVLHAGAIGDVVLGTVVPESLKDLRAEMRIIYWTHESLFGLLGLCPSIDECVPWEKRKGLGDQLSLVRGIKPDIIIDLTASLRTRMICWVSGVRTLRYAKQSQSKRPIIHAAENFRRTLLPLGDVPLVVFPTLKVARKQQQELHEKYGITDGAVGLVPGVGKLRSHRAWPADRWNALAKRLAGGGTQVLFLGGPEDADVVRDASEGVDGARNLCGVLSLPQTAAALSLCSVVVSGDTGPSHIAVGVGKPVVGLLGPTYAERSGPYGNLERSFSATNHCRCLTQKSCTVTQRPGPGACMNEISVDQIFERVSALCLENSRQ